MDTQRRTELTEIARRVRVGILDAVYSAQSGHPGGSLSIADILTYLYFEEMHVDPKIPTIPRATASSFPRVTARPACIPCLRSAATSPSRISRASATPTATCRGTRI